MKSSFLLIFAIVFGFLFFNSAASKVSAATCVWTGDAGANMNTAGSWSGCGGGVPQDGDALTFPATTNSQDLTNNIVGLETDQITINDTYTFTGNEIALTNGSAIVINAEDVVIDFPITGNSNFGITSTEHVSFTNTIDLNGWNLILDTESGGWIKLQDTISGTGNITVYGNGDVSLESANTFTGNISVLENNYFSIYNDASLGNSSNLLSIEDTSVLYLYGPDLTISNDINFEDGSFLFNEEGSAEISGDINLEFESGGSVNFYVVEELHLSGIISGDAESLIKSGTGDMYIEGSSANTFEEIFTIEDGRVFLNKSLAVALASTDIYVGDSSGDAGSALISYLAHGQIADTSTVYVNSDGYINFDGYEDFFDSLEIFSSLVDLNGGNVVVLNLQMIEGEIMTGSGALGIANSMSLSGDTNPAVIGGKLSFGAISGGIDIIGANSAASPDVYINADIFGISDLRFNGGDMIWEGDNSAHAREINISAGKLVLNGDNSKTDVIVSNNGTLGGTGTIKSINTTGGFITPGTSPGILNISGDMILNPTVTTVIELDGAIVGTGYDRVAVDGNVNLAGSTLTIEPGYTPANGTVFTIITSTGTLTGNFAGMANGSTVTAGGLNFIINYTSNSVTLTYGSGNLADTGVNVNIFALMGIMALAGSSFLLLENRIKLQTLYSK